MLKLIVQILLKNIKLKKFKYIEREEHKKDDKKHIGFIANEVQEVLPEEFEAIVNKDRDYLRLNYIEMNNILWKTIQEQMERIDKLESEIKELKGKAKPKEKAKAKAKP